MSIDGGTGKVGEELEKPRNELGGQLLGLDAGLGRINNPLVVLHILQHPNKKKKKRQTLSLFFAGKLIGEKKKKEEAMEVEELVRAKAINITWDLSLDSLRRSPNS